MDDLPELPFEQVLSYLNLKDRLKARTVSRAWRNMFDRYPVKTLCYSQRPSGFIFEKSRWVSGAFAKNFISSSQFALFFDTYGQTILSSLKRLRLCDLDLSKRNGTAFARTLNSFSQLELLDIIRAEFNQQDVLNLNLPMLTSFQLETLHGIKKLTLEAPRLRVVKHLHPYWSDLRLEIVHGESVERLLVDRLENTEVEKLKNLQYLYVDYYVPSADRTFLSSLQHLKELHTNHPRGVSKLFEQKQRSGRADLKIYLYGLLLNGPHDPAINVFRNSFLSYLNRESLVCLAENPSRLADEIPFYRELNYSEIEGVAPGLEVDLLKRFTHLNEVIVDRIVRDIPRFLDLLKNFENIVVFEFDGVQPQELFDQLPEHCTVQKLSIVRAHIDLALLFPLKHLIHLDINWQIGSETVRRAFEELPLLSSFEFVYDHKMIRIKTDHPKQFQVSIEGQNNARTTVSDLNAVIEFITGKLKPSNPKKHTTNIH